MLLKKNNTIKKNKPGKIIFAKSNITPREIHNTNLIIYTQTKITKSRIIKVKNYN